MLPYLPYGLCAPLLLLTSHIPPRADFDDGYVDTSDNGPGFFENLLSGGKMQREYDERMRKRRGGK